jgi:hypothetical protein
MSFRNAANDGGEVTLWVINCRADHRAARQLDPQQRTRRQEVGVAVRGQERSCPSGRRGGPQALSSSFACCLRQSRQRRLTRR